MTQRVATAITPPTFGALGMPDWETVTLAQGSSVAALLHARGIPVTREVLAAIAQANGIRDFRQIAAGTPLWLPKRESLTGERAAMWREAYQSITPDNFATVDRDRAARTTVQPRQTAQPRLAAPRSGPRPQADRDGEPVPDGDLDQPALRAIPPGMVLGEQRPDAPQATAPVLTAGPQVVAEQPVTEPAVRAAQPAAPTPPPNAEQRMQQLVQALSASLHGDRDRDKILELTYALMSSPDWTNEQARRAYANGSPNEWQLIADLRNAGLDPRDVLRASEYVWNDERTPFDGQVSPAIRAVLAAVGYRQRSFGQLDAAVGTADLSLEDALWEIIDTIGVDTANAIIYSRAGANPAGMVDNLRYSHDPQQPGILGTLRDMINPDRRPAPLDGAITAPPPGVNPLADIIGTEYARWKNVLSGFSGYDRDRLLAILRMPPGTDRRAFGTALAATSASGEDFLKLFEGKTREQMDTIAAAFAAGFGQDHGGSLATHALGRLDGDQMVRFQALLLGTRSDPAAAARYIALTLRARASDKDALRNVLHMIGSTESGTPRWQDVVAADYQLNPARSQGQPLERILAALGNDAMVLAITRDYANPDEPVSIARRILASRDRHEIEALLRRTDGDLFNDQELAIMNQTAARLTGTDPAANPSALYDHVSKMCTPASEAATIVQRVGGPRVEAPLYDETGRLSPAAQLFFALQRKDSEAITTILSRTPFVALGALEAAYPAVAQQLAQAGATVPGNTPNVRDAIRAVLKGDERQRALQFMTGVNVTSSEAAGQTGMQLAAQVTQDLEARCAWLLRAFDHEREPLRERLMQFQVTLGHVLAAVEERRNATGQPQGLTEEEQARLGEAVRRLVGQRRNFELERDALARSIQDTTIMVSTTVASIALTVGTAGLGAAPSAALWATAMSIARVAAVGTIAGLATAPLQGGDNRYLTGGLKGFAFGSFAGLGAAAGPANIALSKVIPGAGLFATTVRNGIVMSTVWGGLSATGNIGVEFDSTGEMVRKVGGDYLRGAAFGLGFAGLMGLAGWLLRYANGGAMVPPTGTRIGADGALVQDAAATANLGRYAAARDLTSLEKAFAEFAADGIPPGTRLALDAEGRTLLETGINRHLAALARTRVSTAAQLTEQARWMTTLAVYADAGGIQLKGPALESAMQILQRLGANVPTGLTEAQARALLQRTVMDLLQGGQPLQAAAAAPAPRAAPPVGQAANADRAARGVRLVHGGTNQATELRSWAAVSTHARTAGTRATPLQAALHTREELSAVKAMLDTPQGRQSLASMQRELGPIAPRDLAGLQRSVVAAMGRVDQQIATGLRTEATQLARATIPAGDVTPFYERLARLNQMNETLTAMRSHGMTRELFDAVGRDIAQARTGLDSALAARIRETFAAPGLDPRQMLGTLTAFRDGLRAQGFADGAPATMRAFNDAIQKMQQAAARAPRAA